MQAGHDPAGLSRAGRRRVDPEGRIDLVIQVRGRLAALVRWIRLRGSRIVAVVPWAHECEAWVPAALVIRLAERPGLVLIRFPHYAISRR
jgi:hypothetical protein